MEIVIKIPDEVYNIAKYGQYGNINVDVVRKAIADGTPLPEHHGRLIDADVIQKYQIDTYGQGLKIIDDAPTIIEGSDSK